MTSSKSRERRVTIVSLSSFSSQHSKLSSVVNSNNDDNNNVAALGLDEEDQASLEDSVSTISRALSVVDLEKDMLFIKRCIQMQVKQLVKLLMLFTLYIVCGMFIFFYIEECSGGSKPGDNSYLHRDDVVPGDFTNKTELCSQLLGLFDTQYNNNSSTLKTNKTPVDVISSSYVCQVELTNATYEVVVKGAKKPNCVMNEFSLLKYAEFTVFTCLTIGYGNITPETIIGRWSLIFYAIVGMPLALTMYSVAGKLVVQLITYLLDMFQSRVYKKPSEEVRHLQLKTLALSVVLFVFIILMGCLVTSAPSMENLDFSSSFYFWFISLSTIGYGDITFKRDQHLKSPHMLVLAVLNLLFGIGILAAIIAAISLVLEKRDLKMSTIIIDNDDEEELISDDEDDDINDEIGPSSSDDYDYNKDNFLPHAALEKMRKKRKQDRMTENDAIDDDEHTCITNLSSEESLNNDRPKLRSPRSTLIISVSDQFKEDTLMLLKKRLAANERIQEIVIDEHKQLSNKCSKINPSFECET